MKAQFEVSEEVWGRVKVASMLACKSIGEMLEPVLSEAFPKNGPVDLKMGKVVLSPEPKAFVVKGTGVGDAMKVEKPVEPLKEGHGWCLGCKTRQVKLPGLLCKECAK